MISLHLALWALTFLPRTCRLYTQCLCLPLGIPLADEDEEGLSAVITLLGIQMNTEQGTLSLPAEKLEWILHELELWADRKWCCRRHMLDSPIQLVQHAARVVRPGRSFLHDLIALLQGGCQDNYYIHLNKKVHSDIHW